jgi:RNA polymerase sigma-70 factor (ECF subfamily)
VLRDDTDHEKESEWLARALQKDSEAYGHLVEVYQGPVYNLCYRMLGDPDEAEDASQESFMRAFFSIQRYDIRRPFSTWLLSIAAHYCIDQLRRRRVKLIPFQDLQYEDFADPSPNPEAATSMREEQQSVRILLEGLNPIDRAAVILFYWHAFSYDQIAESLNITVSAVKSRLHRAREEMAKTYIHQSSGAESVGRRGNESPAF